MVADIGLPADPEPKPLPAEVIPILPVPDADMPKFPSPKVDDKVDETLLARKQVEAWVAAHRVLNPTSRPAPIGVPVSPLLDCAPDGTWPVVLTTADAKADA